MKIHFWHLLIRYETSCLVSCLLLAFSSKFKLVEFVEKTGLRQTDTLGSFSAILYEGDNFQFL